MCLKQNFSYNLIAGINSSSVLRNILLTLFSLNFSTANAVSLVPIPPRYYIQSIWIAIGYLLLALEEKGLAPVTYTLSKVRWFNEFLGIPKKYILQTILPIGKPALDKYKKQPRKQLDELILAIT